MLVRPRLLVLDEGYPSSVHHSTFKFSTTQQVCHQSLPASTDSRVHRAHGLSHRQLPHYLPNLLTHCPVPSSKSAPLKVPVVAPVRLFFWSLFHLISLCWQTAPSNLLELCFSYFARPLLAALSSIDSPRTACCDVFLVAALFCSSYDSASFVDPVHQFALFSVNHKHPPASLPPPDNHWLLPVTCYLLPVAARPLPRTKQGNRTVPSCRTRQVYSACWNLARGWAFSS